jgi:hypothetical protein
VNGVGQWGDARRQGVSAVRKWQRSVRGLNCWALLRMCSTPPRRQSRSRTTSDGWGNLAGPSAPRQRVNERPGANVRSQPLVDGRDQHGCLAVDRQLGSPRIPVCFLRIRGFP